MEIKSNNQPWAAIASITCALSALLLIAFVLPKTSFFSRSAHGELLHEETSNFSKIRVRGDEAIRRLIFVSETGSEQLQSSINLDNPGELQVAYTRALFASLLFKPTQKRILIVGLGGGGMVRFVEKNLPETVVEAVEIDPAVVRIAADYFHTKPGKQVKIHTADAFDFLAEDANGPYDVIYMDAFLRPSVDKQSDGKTGRLKTVEFLNTIRDRLTEDGILACNLITHRSTTSGDLEALSQAFKEVHQVKVRGTGNMAVFALQKPLLQNRESLNKAAIELEAKFSNIPFVEYSKAIP